MKPVLAGMVALGLTGCAWFRPIVQPGEAVAPFAFRVSDGGDSVRSSRLLGRPGVLMWIDPLCPRVDSAAQSQGPLRMLESRWNSTDSVWFYYVAARTEKATVLEAKIWRPWLKEMKLRGSVILDTAMVLAKALGVDHVPAAVVLGPDMTLRWRGGLDQEEEGGPTGASLVLDSVLHDKPLPALSKAREGCPIRDRLW